MYTNLCTCIAASKESIKMRIESKDEKTAKKEQIIETNCVSVFARK